MNQTNVVFAYSARNFCAIWHTYLARRITMISKVVPPGRGLFIALSNWADICDYPELGWLERIIFGSGDKRSRCPS